MNIRESFADKEVLVTGATGLVGKVLLEKILRDLPDVRLVHVLIRSKVMRSGKVVTPEERLQREVLGSSAFDRLRRIHGDSFASMTDDKIRVVAGDLTEQDLGIDQSVYRSLQGSVGIIINCAAEVAFDASIRDSIALNTRGPLRILEFARGCTAPVLAQVSTCYVNGTREGVAEELPLSPTRDLLPAGESGGRPYDVDEEVASIDAAIQEVEDNSRRPWRRAAFAYAAKRSRNGSGKRNLEDRSDVAESLRKEWVEARLVAEGSRKAKTRGWHDVYTFTKAMGEQMIVRNRGDVSTVIFRPSIIESALDEPEPGWLEGFRMLDPLIVAYGRGQLPDFPGNPKSIMDLVPVDKVVNAILACVAATKGRPQLAIYHLATGADNRLTFEEFTDLAIEHFKEKPLYEQGAPAPTPDITFPSTRVFLLRIRLLYMAPLRVLEAMALLASVSPWGRRHASTFRSRRSALQRLAYWVQIYEPYADVRCQYRASRMSDLLAELSEEDRERFDFDVAHIDWRHYIQDVHIPGIKRFLLKRDTKGQRGQSQTGAKPARASDTTEDDARSSGTAPATRQQSPMPSDLTANEVERQLGSMWAWHALRRSIRWLWSLGYKYYLGFQVEGVERLPTSRPFILAPNHNSHLDTGAMLVILGGHIDCLHPVAAKDYWFRNRVTSWASRIFLDAIPFDRQERFSRSLSLARAMIRDNHSLLYFPEGGRSPTGEMQPFKGGLGVLALQSGAPIVPAKVSGTFEAMPKGRWFPRRHEVQVTFGDPIFVEPYLQTDTDVDTSELARKITEDAQKAVEAL